MSRGKYAFAALSAVLLVFGIVFLVLYSVTPRYYGDTSGYQYRIVVSSVWFDAPQELVADRPIQPHIQRITYYTNEYEIRKIRDFDRPIEFVVKHYAQFNQHSDGNYYLVQSGNVEFGYLPDDYEDITVIRQSDNKVIFNSTAYIYSYKWAGP